MKASLTEQLQHIVDADPELKKKLAGFHKDMELKEQQRTEAEQYEMQNWLKACGHEFPFFEALKELSTEDHIRYIGCEYKHINRDYTWFCKIFGDTNPYTLNTKTMSAVVYYEYNEAYICWFTNDINAYKKMPAYSSKVQLISIEAIRKNRGAYTPVTAEILERCHMEIGCCIMTNGEIEDELDDCMEDLFDSEEY